MQPDIIEEVQLDTRLAGQVKRYHTWPTIHSQNIAEHTWQVLRIYLFCLGEEPINPHIVADIMYHDIGEIYVGDPPYPIKRDNPSLKESLDRLEHWSYAAQLSHWDAFRQIMVTKGEMILIKQIHCIEMAEYGMDEINLGNSHGWHIANRCLKAVYNDEHQPCGRLADYVTIRLKLFYRQHRGHTDQKLDEWWIPMYWEVRHGSERKADRGESLQNGV